MALFVVGKTKMFSVSLSRTSYGNGKKSGSRSASLSTFVLESQEIGIHCGLASLGDWLRCIVARPAFFLVYETTPIPCIHEVKIEKLQPSQPKQT